MLAKVIAVTALCALPLAARAQGSDPLAIGQAEFLNSCAQCHGEDGKGDGVMSSVLSHGAPDLTQLQKANGGVFPVSRVYAVITGQSNVVAHGTGEMPAWGFRYKLHAPTMLGPYYTKDDEEAFVKGRILALVEYISTLQVK